jgi:hypothetical protein
MHLVRDDLEGRHVGGVQKDQRLLSVNALSQCDVLLIVEVDRCIFPGWARAPQRCEYTQFQNRTRGPRVSRQVDKKQTPCINERNK